MVVAADGVPEEVASQGETFTSLVTVVVPHWENHVPEIDICTHGWT